MPKLISICGTSLPGEAFSKLKPKPFSPAAHPGRLGSRISVRATMRAAPAQRLKSSFFVMGVDLNAALAITVGSVIGVLAWGIARDHNIEIALMHPKNRT